jgi:hypothetical protein
MMRNNKLRKLSIMALIAGYCLATGFITLIVLNHTPELELVEIASTSTPVVEEVIDDKLLFVGHPMDDDFVDPKIIVGTEVVYTDHLTPTTTVVDRAIRHPRLVDVRDGLNTVYVDSDREFIVDGYTSNAYVDDIDRLDRQNWSVNGETRHGGNGGNGGNGHRNQKTVVDTDPGLLDRRLAQLETDFREDNIVEVDDVSTRDKFGIDGENLTGLTIDRGDGDLELGDITGALDGFGKGGTGFDRGDLYAYNYPSQGVGAGIGSGGVGATAGLGAGLGAGVGEAVLGGETVPTLGGVGTYSSIQTVPPGTGTDADKDGLSTETEISIGTDPTKSDSDGDGYSDGAEVTSYTDPSNPSSNPGVPGSAASPIMGGVGGLVGGAGAGGAAGLVTGMVKKPLGTGVGAGVGKGCAEHGVGCSGHHGKHADYDHLPKDGALHIMMHVDGSGSILGTRKQLTIMKDTLLKDALLPYYDNNEDLYNRRVTIVDGNGERTLQFFTEASKKDNVLAVVFQDEAAPAYHLPTFNKKPQDHYSKDIGKLKASLNGYGGVYRGVMFQVDRGKTFAKSFKEFVESAWRGEGYLKTSNLKKYYRDNNTHHIKNKDGVVFSDEYHAADSGDPQYYLDLIFAASKKIGLDLDIYGAGITDGKYNKKIN